MSRSECRHMLGPVRPQGDAVPLPSLLSLGGSAFIRGQAPAPNAPGP